MWERRSSNLGRWREPGGRAQAPQIHRERRGGPNGFRRKKGETVVRLLRGEDLELVSRELGVTAARLWRWREAFVAGGQQALRKQGPGTRDEEVSRLKTKVGSAYLSDDFQSEIAFWGMESSPAFVREPEGNGCAERFIRTLKENLLWTRSFDTIDELREALAGVSRPLQPGVDH